jgi:hypothetical protein
MGPPLGFRPFDLSFKFATSSVHVVRTFSWCQVKALELDLRDIEGAGRTQIPVRFADVEHVKDSPRSGDHDYQGW